jgi:hypothetical protein
MQFELIYKYQAGFLPGHSTITQLVEVSHLIYQELDDLKEVSILFVDISKAFDRVWHSGLLYKLKTICVDDNLLEWFESYL